MTTTKKNRKRRGVIRRAAGEPLILPAATQEHYTPGWLAALIAEAFGGGIDLDPCGAPGAAVEATTVVWTEEHARSRRAPLPPGVVVGDGLTHRWTGRTFVNPPYGTGPLNRWIPKARESAQDGAHVAMLLPSATSRQAWQAHVPAARLVCFISGRLRFGGLDTGAGFSSAIVLWTNNDAIALRFAGEIRRAGHVMFNPGGAA